MAPATAQGAFHVADPLPSTFLSGPARSGPVTSVAPREVGAAALGGLSLGISVAAPGKICVNRSVQCPARAGAIGVTLSAAAQGSPAGVAARGTSQPIFQFVPTASVRVVPGQSIVPSCLDSTGGSYVYCAAGTTTRNLSGVTVLQWNWSDAPSYNEMYGGNLWTVSFLVYAAGPPLRSVPVDACVTLPCRAAGSTDVNGSFTWATYSLPPNTTPVVQSFQYAMVDVEPTWPAYPVTFSESGLPSGTHWSVTLNASLLTSASSTITVDVPNGTYPYSVGPVSEYASAPSSGNVDVQGGPSSVPITFGGVSRPVWFNETGLASGTNWSVGISREGSGLPITYSSVTDSIHFELPTLFMEAFTVSGEPGFSPNPFAGQLGPYNTTAPLSEWILYKPNTTALFIESGLPLDGMTAADWSVTIVGTGASSGTYSNDSVGDEIGFQLPLGFTGTYNVSSIRLEAKGVKTLYAPNPAAGVIVVDLAGLWTAHQARVYITYSVPVPAPTFLGLPELEGTVVLAGVIAAVFAAVVVATRRRKNERTPDELRPPSPSLGGGKPPAGP